MPAARRAAADKSGTTPTTSPTPASGVHHRDLASGVKEITEPRKRDFGESHKRPSEVGQPRRETKADTSAKVPMVPAHAKGKTGPAVHGRSDGTTPVPSTPVKVGPADTGDDDPIDTSPKVDIKKSLALLERTYQTQPEKRAGKSAEATEASAHRTGQAVRHGPDSTTPISPTPVISPRLSYDKAGKLVPPPPPPTKHHQQIPLSHGSGKPQGEKARLEIPKGYPQIASDDTVAATKSKKEDPLPETGKREQREPVKRSAGVRKLPISPGASTKSRGQSGGSGQSSQLLGRHKKDE